MVTYTYTVVPVRGSYRVMAKPERGEPRVVATFPTEEAAVAYLRELRKQAGVAPVAQEQHRTRGWRE